jgi:Tol biopolymer transport system component
MPVLFPIAHLAAAATLAFSPAAHADENTRNAPPEASTRSTRLVLVSRADGATGKPSVPAQAGAISANGRYAAFTVKGRLYLRDIRANRTQSVLGDLVTGAHPTFTRSFSPHSGTIVYSGDGKLWADNLATAGKSFVSRTLPALRGESDLNVSGAPSISADGRYVAFESSSNALVDENGDGRIDQGYPRYQVYLRDLKRGATTLISRAGGPAGAIGDGESSEPAISADGRYVAFTSEAGNLVPGAPRPGAGIYVRDLRTDTVRRVSYWSSRPGPHRGEGSRPSISANGRYVSFVFNRTGSPASVVVRDLRAGGTVNASLLTENPLKLGRGTPELSEDGRFVAFRTGEAAQGQLDRLYVADLETERTRLVGSASAEPGSPLSFSASGRYLLFDTFVDANVPKGAEPSVPAHGDVYRYTNAFLP